MNALALINNQNLIVNQNNDIDIMNRFIGKVSNKWVDVNVNLQRTNNFILQMGESTNQLNKSIDTSSKKSNNLLDKVKKVSESLFSLSNAKLAFNATVGGAAKAREQLIGFQNLMGDKEVGKVYLDKVSKQGIKSGFSPDDVVNNTRGFMKVTKNTDKLDNLNGMAARLAVTNPSKGVGESGTAIQNAMSGKFDDLQNKFNFTEADTQILKASKSLDEFMKKMDDMLNKKGLTDKNLGGFSESPLAQVNQLKNNIDDSLSGAGEGALDALMPALTNINKMFSNGDFNGVFDGIAKGLELVGQIAYGIAGVFMDIANIVQNNWSLIGPIIWGIVGALIAYQVIAFVANIVDGISTVIKAFKTEATVAETAAQWGLNTALLACPLTWIIIAIVAVIAMIIAWAAYTNGLQATWLMFVDMLLTSWDIIKICAFGMFIRVMDLFGNMEIGLWRATASVADAFGNMKAEGMMILQNFINGSIDLINKLIGYVNKIPGVSIDAISHVEFGTDAKLENEAEKALRQIELNKRIGEIDGEKQARHAKLASMAGEAMQDHINRTNKIEAVKAKAKDKDKKSSILDKWNSENLLDNFKMPADQVPTQSSMPASNLQNNFNTTNENLQNGNDKIDISNEHLEMLRDLAEIESVQNFVTLTPSVEITTGDIKEEADINTIISKIENYMKTELVNSAEGVYV